MTDTRTTIATYIEANPGVHFNEIVRSLNMATGQVQHHVYRLLNSGQIVEEQLYGRTHYYPPGMRQFDRRALALLRQETARNVLLSLLATPGARPGDVAEHVGVARSTMEWHLSHLVEQDLVEKRHDERGHVTLYPTHPDDTARLLEEITPSLPDRLVDRYIRLLDQLFEDA